MPVPFGHIAEYTERISGVPRMVWPGDARHPAHVIFWSGPGTTERVYTWSPWAASFCEQAYQQKKAITAAYSTTSYGKLLIDVDYAEPEVPA